MKTAGSALAAAIERVDIALSSAESELDAARDALFALKTLIGVTEGDPDRPDPAKERKMLEEWNRISGRTAVPA